MKSGPDVFADALVPSARPWGPALPDSKFHCDRLYFASNLRDRCASIAAMVIVLPNGRVNRILNSVGKAHKPALLRFGAR
jgi:hypothetical protein